MTYCIDLKRNLCTEQVLKYCLKHDWFCGMLYVFCNGKLSLARRSSMRFLCNVMCCDYRQNCIESKWSPIAHLDKLHLAQSSAIDLFTINVSQIYGCFFPWDLVKSHFINLYLTMVYKYLESTLYTLVVATSDKLIRIWARTSFQVVGNNLCFIMVCIKLVNRSILD